MASILKRILKKSLFFMIFIVVVLSSNVFADSAGVSPSEGTTGDYFDFYFSVNAPLLSGYGIWVQIQGTDGVYYNYDSNLNKQMYSSDQQNFSGRVQINYAGSRKYRFFVTEPGQSTAMKNQYFREGTITVREKPAVVQKTLRAPYIQSPYYGQEVSSDLSIQWNAGENAEWYIVSLRDLTDNTQVSGHYDRVTYGTNYYVPSSALIKGHRYRISVKSAASFTSDTVGAETVEFSVKAPTVQLRAPSITSPSYNQEVSGDVSIRWNAGENAEWYIVSLRDLTDNTQVSGHYDRITYGTSYNVPSSALIKGHRYRISVKSAASFTSDTIGAETVEFNVKAQILQLRAPSITSPSYGQEISGDMSIRWNAGENAEWYILSLRDLTDNTQVSGYYDKTIYGTNFTVPLSSLVKGHRYRISVKSAASFTSDTVGAETVEFTVKPLILQLKAPSITSPSYGQEVSGDVSIRWNTGENAEWYILSLRDLTDNTQVSGYYDKTIYGTNFTVPSSSLVRGHRYRISVKSAASFTSDTIGAETVEFTVKTLIPQLKAPSINTPYGGQEVSGSVEIKWNAGENAEWYIVSLRDVTENTQVSGHYDKKIYGTSYTVPSSALVMGHRYRVSVKSAASFTTDTIGAETIEFVAKLEKVLKAPIISAPTNNQKMSGDVSIQWNVGENAEWYILSVRDLTTNETLNGIYDLRVDKTNYKIPESALKKDHRYRVSVKSAASFTKETIGAQTIEFTYTSTDTFRVEQKNVEMKSNGELEIEFVGFDQGGRTIGFDIYLLNGNKSVAPWSASTKKSIQLSSGNTGKVLYSQEEMAAWLKNGESYTARITAFNSQNEKTTLYTKSFRFVNQMKVEENSPLVISGSGQIAGQSGTMNGIAIKTTTNIKVPVVLNFDSIDSISALDKSSMYVMDEKGNSINFELNKNGKDVSVSINQEGIQSYYMVIDKMVVFPDLLLEAFEALLNNDEELFEQYVSSDVLIINVQEKK